jgi:hypothetical protein
MTEWLNVALKISLVIFMAGNLLGMGLQLRLGTALAGLRDLRFVSLSLLWCFVLGPAVAWGLTRVIPLEPPYAMGLILIGLAPCAPFLPMMVDRARGDIGYTASFMLLASVGMVATMPLAVPLLVDGLSVSAWMVAKPLVAVVLLPLVLGMVILRRASAFAERAQPVVKKITGLATVVMLLHRLGGQLRDAHAGAVLRRRHRRLVRAGLRAAAGAQERARTRRVHAQPRGRVRAAVRGRRHRRTRDRHGRARRAAADTRGLRRGASVRCTRRRAPEPLRTGHFGRRSVASRQRGVRTSAASRP